MKSFMSLFLIATCSITLTLATIGIAEANSKQRVNKIQSYNPAQRKKLFEWALKECSKQYGGAGYHTPDINYTTGKIWCR